MNPAIPGRPVRWRVSPGLSALLLLSLVLAGCSLLKPKADLTRFYVLRARPVEGAAHARTNALPMEIRVGPGSVAGHLEATPIAVEDGAHRIDYLDRHHWAGPLPQAIGRTLAADLAQRLQIPLPTLYPDPLTRESSLEVRYAVQRLEGTLDGPLTLEVSWQLFQRPSGRLVADRHFVHVIPAGGPSGDVTGYVERMSQAIDRWAEDVAAAVRSVSGAAH